MWLTALWILAIVLGVGFLVSRFGTGSWADLSDFFDGDGDGDGGGCGGCGGGD